MTTQCCGVQKLPSAWWGLFVTFQSEQKPHVAAEVWWRNATMSTYGEMPEWATLLGSLVSQEPKLIDENLIFCPTFFLLSEGFQKYLLLFLTRHATELPEHPTKEFFDAIQQNIECISSSRIQTLFENFQYDCKLIWNQDLASNHHLSHVFSQENQVKLDKILKSAVTAQEYNPFLPPLLKDGLKKTDENMKSPKCHVTLLEPCCDITVPESPVIVIHSDSSVCEETMEVSNDAPVPPEASKSTIIPDVQECHTLPSPMEIPSDKLPTDIEVKANQLKYIWQQGNMAGEELSTKLNLFIECSDQQVQQICKILDVESLPEASFAMVCRHLAAAGNQISYANSLVLARHCILPWFVKQSEQNSRLLVSAFVTFCQQFPKPFVDGVLIPCAETKKLDLPRAKLMAVVNKDAFSTNNRLYLIEQLSKSCPTIEHGILNLLGNLLDGKLELSPEQLSQLLLWLKNATTSENHSNTIYGRFLLTFINKHKKQLKKEHISCLHQIMEHHQTSLKTSIMNALKKLAK
ncbi:uncharacterized protein LOC115213826 [Argonauta hians]